MSLTLSSAPIVLVPQLYPVMEQAQQFSVESFTVAYRQQITSLLHKIGSKSQKINLEGGHIYSDEVPTLQHCIQLRIMAMFRDIIIAAGHEVSTMLFVDNYHPTNHTLDVSEYVILASQFGVTFDEVVMEADLVSIAEQNHLLLVASGKTKMKEGISVLAKTGAHLKKSDGELSCGLLDATLSAKKLTKSDTGVIILPIDNDLTEPGSGYLSADKAATPHEYKAQQKNMRNILQALLQIKGQQGAIHSFFTKH